jgi:hypothetical protein
MEPDQFVLTLSPREGGAYTRLSLSGTAPTALPKAKLRGLLRMLSFWSGWPVTVALSVEADAAGWCEWWTDALCAVPEGQVEVRFELARAVPHKDQAS